MITNNVIYGGGCLSNLRPCYPSGAEKSRNENNSHENKALPTGMIPDKKKQFYLNGKRSVMNGV